MTRKPNPRPRIIPVFDRGRSVGAKDPAVRLGLAHLAGNHGESDHYQAHRTSRDSRPPRSVVTAQLMGDPAPGRSALAMTETST